jgi:Right handed beta helix region
MQLFASRAGRWPLALTVAVLGACAEEPAGPTLSAPLRPNAAVGDVFLVTNTNDSGIGSLRWSLGFTTGGEIIRFDPSIAGQTISLDSTLYLYKSVAIEGPAGAGITINGAGKERVFRAMYASGLATLRNLTITGANSGEGAGGVFFGDGKLVIENSLIHDNKAGGAIAIVADTVTITNSTISGTTLNSPTTFDYPVVMGNNVVVTNSTIAHNAWGGLGSPSTGRVTIRNSIIANNDGKNCVVAATATLVREGSNISDDDTCGGPTEILIADPKLGALADNGGPTKTYALLAGSPAINAGTSCSVQVDQRYAARDAQCDLGAYEFVDFTQVTITIDPSSAVNQGNGWATLTGTVKCSRSETFSLALELHQQQRAGKETTDVHAAATEPIACTTIVRPWSASMVLTDGSFQSGNATATAQTFDAEPWVAPAAAGASVKLYRSRK